MVKENKRTVQAKSQLATEEARHSGRVLETMKGDIRQGVEKVAIMETGMTGEDMTNNAQCQM